MKILRPVLYLVLILAGAFALFLVYATIDDYRPVNVELLYDDDQVPSISDSSRFQLLIWNIGFAGLDASMDFFKDGGKQTRTSGEHVIENLTGILSILVPYKAYDFILLQEVDRDAKRSHHRNQLELIQEHFQEHQAFFGTNFKVSFVPIPVRDPLGKVESGLFTLSKYVPSGVSRHSFPGNFSWPVRPFHLDRCFLVNRYPLSDGSSLLVINTHNSAYDDGSLREQQMAFLKDFLLYEYDKGNYIIVGGDWNQTPFGFEPSFPGHMFDTINLTYLEPGYPEADWTWAYDPGMPTNRRIDTPYDRATSLTTVIDYYLLSPNIELESVRTMDVDFAFSDHQPVQLRVKLISGNPN